VASTLIGAALDDLDTPALLIDLDTLDANIGRVQAHAAERGWKLRPHTKTHKIPAIAHRQLTAGAAGITVAKTGEAEVMAAAGITDIFIANQVVGPLKLRRLAALAREIRLAVGVDHPVQARALSEAFRHESQPLAVLIEVDTGAQRAGVPPGEPARQLAGEIAALPGLELRGIYTHEGQDYAAATLDELSEIAHSAQSAMVETAALLEADLGRPCWVSIGSTPSLSAGVARPGIHELRAGTSVFYDAFQTQLTGHLEWCAATVLATITSTPAADRAIADAGAKALSIDRRESGLLARPGHGAILGHADLQITGLSDEHAVIRGADAGRRLTIGDRVRIIPNHVCPTVNLHDVAVGLRGEHVETVWPVAARGRTQ
jgi:D-serine deaminase-like pyridoxal phosphate-dependent protein